MATYENLISLDRLSEFKTAYDGVMATAIATAEAQSLHTVVLSNTTLKFYKEMPAEVTSETTPAFSINLPQQDLSNLMTKISGAQGGKIAQTKADGTVEESTVAIADLETKAHAGTIPAGATATTIVGYAKEVADSKDTAIQAAASAASTAQGEVDALETYVGTIPSGATATDVVGYAAEVADAVADDLDTLDQSLAAIAKSGDSADASYDNTTSGLTATDVQSAIDEVVGGLGTAAAADIATTAIQVESTDDGLVSAEQVAAFVAQEIAGLEGAMHFVGVITRQTGETDAQAIARVVTDPESGDVVVM